LLPMPTLTDIAEFVTFHGAAGQEYLWEWFKESDLC
jgi:hypothetical protein